MGGQACVLYGAAEFSKDFDFVLLLEEKNLIHFRNLLNEIQAEVIAVPPFETEYLKRGHAVHFRARALEFELVRLDIMTKLRGVDPFADLWKRRTSAQLLPGLTAEILSLSDLVQAKKTQRDKDWPMIRRLVDVDYISNRVRAEPEQIRFWLRELRTPAFLIECVSKWPMHARAMRKKRSRVLKAALEGNNSATEGALRAEETVIRTKDKRYWAPLIKELETLRRKARK